MTQITKWWHRIGYWNKIKGTLTSVGIGSEVVLYVQDSHVGWRYFALGMTVLGIIITQWIQDDNNNGKVDLFEKDKTQ